MNIKYKYHRNYKFRYFLPLNNTLRGFEYEDFIRRQLVCVISVLNKHSLYLKANWMENRCLTR